MAPRLCVIISFACYSPVSRVKGFIPVCLTLTIPAVFVLLAVAPTLCRVSPSLPPALLLFKSWSNSGKIAITPFFMASGNSFLSGDSFI